MMLQLPLLMAKAGTDSLYSITIEDIDSASAAWKQAQPLCINADILRSAYVTSYIMEETQFRSYLLMLGNCLVSGADSLGKMMSQFGSDLVSSLKLKVDGTDSVSSNASSTITIDEVGAYANIPLEHSLYDRPLMITHVDNRHTCPEFPENTLVASMLSTSDYVVFDWTNETTNVVTVRGGILAYAKASLPEAMLLRALSKVFPIAVHIGAEKAVQMFQAEMTNNYNALIKTPDMHDSDFAKQCKSLNHYEQWSRLLISKIDEAMTLNRHAKTLTYDAPSVTLGVLLIALSRQSS